MEENLDSEDQTMLEDHYSQNLKIDPKRARFPCCVVWVPLPLISWLVPFIGHMGICKEDGVIMDFAGPNFVSVDNFSFGAVARYIQIDKEKECCLFQPQSAYEMKEEYNLEEAQGENLTWDETLKKSTQEYQHHSYSLFTCNCHSYVANGLNRLGFQSGGWNVVNLAYFMLLKGTWVSLGSMIRSYLPFFAVFCLGVLFGGSAFLTFWFLISILLLGWFLLATYVIKDAIHV